MIFPPLQRSIISNIGDKKNQVDHVWYGFFRAMYETLFGAIGSTASNALIGLAGKLNAYTPGGSIGWEDLRASATAINPTGIVAAPSYNDTYIGYDFSASTAQRIDILFQLPHGWKKGTNIRPHVHCRPMANSGGNVVWQLHTSWSNNFGQQPDFTITNSNMVITNSTGNIILKEHIFPLGNSVPNTSSNESSIVKYKLLRVGNDGGDTYAGVMLFDEFDCHYQHEKAGSQNEYPT